jgi:hypothetical protein
MLISKKIEKLNKLAKTLVKRYWECPSDFTMIGLEYTSQGWSATVMFEFLGDGHPQYLDDPADNGKLILQSIAKTLPGALNSLEKRMLEMLSEET